jgi:hypothetical protein
MVARYTTYSHLPTASDENIDDMVNRLETIFLSGTPELVAAGSQWYATRHQDLQDLSLLTAIPVDVLAYVTSALSPRTNWRDNWHAVMQTLHGWVHEDKAPVRSATLYGANDAKAFRILQAWDDGLSMGTIREILGKGPKTHAFARNLTECATLADGDVAITIDSISYQAATGIVPSSGICGGRYHRVGRAFAFLARKYGLPLYVFQAILWTIFRQTGA